jgi:hypothetical protein
MRVLLGFLLGVLALGAARFILTPWPDPVHHHANWALFVEDAQVDLSDKRYMEDVAACAAGEHITARQRVHMHEGIDEVVHVHHDGVTWGHFLANLGWSVGDDWLLLDDGRSLAANDSTLLVFVVNGFVVPSIRERLIASGDRLLISYGATSEEAALSRQFPQVADNAAEYNAANDPASCAGGHGELTAGERIRRAFWN